MFFTQNKEGTKQHTIRIAEDRKAALCFCIVVYREEYNKTNAFISLIKSFSYSGCFLNVYVYDNTDLPYWNVTVAEAYLPDIAVHYYSDKTNAGISKAYNFLAAKAREKGLEWIVFLDQDTWLPEDAVNEYNDAIYHQPEILIKAPVLLVDGKVFSPFRFFFKRSNRIRKLVTGPASLRNIAVVNSGMLVNLDFFFKINGYDERVKLDFSDFLFLDRVKRQTDKIEILKFCCKHEFSNNETDKIKVIRRFSIYIADLKNCPKPTIKSRLEYFMLALFHTAKLSLRFRTLDFLKIWSSKKI